MNGSFKARDALPQRGAMSRTTSLFSDGLMSCTDKIELSQPFQLDGKEVVLVDTPGWMTQRRTTQMFWTLSATICTPSKYNNDISKLSRALTVISGTPTAISSMLSCTVSPTTDPPSLSCYCLHLLASCQLVQTKKTKIPTLHECEGS